MADRSAVSELAERAMRSTLLTLSHQKALGDLATKLPVTRPMVRRFVAGETFEETVPAIERLRQLGMGTTVDVLGEAVSEPAGAAAARDRYLAVVDALADRGLDRNVSLKPSQMGLKMDPALARENIGAIVAKAAPLGFFIRIDMEDHPYTDATLELWRELRPSSSETGADIGLVIQAALRRSDADVEAILAERGRIRLCKGAYKEPDAVAYQEKHEVDEAYERLMLRLLRSGGYHALATHDVRLIKRAIEFAKAEGIAPDAFEFQMLYGVRRDIQEQLAAAGWRVRVYVPFGGQWYPYFMRRLAERPANVSFLLRNLWRERGRA
ncbi:MAG TPA: proline dehydrogenase family protein [Candidatus Limnocylindrales bacterium]|nr:proline dehydrogenase family protein [Candidatus Limnocylindrales bacterium]